MRGADFSGTRLGITIGLAVVDPERCTLTDRELLAQANEAKPAAKGKIGVSCTPDYARVDVVEA